ncbi:MAG: hypothetical protein HYV33_00050 [Candidatus Kerfeldbacteria bacterium]|nr:hypothetical protein [Candidatus Kerfeldbacteria bacterium]
MPIYTHPFECDDCNQYPKEDLVIFQPDEEVDDWLMFYPERNLIHVHFGVSTPDEAANTAETIFIRDQLLRWVKQYPEKKFCILIDMSRADDSEYVSDQSKKMYAELLRHPQYGLAVFYGMRPGMTFLINMLLFFSRTPAKIVRTKAEADAAYNDWFKTL